MKADFPRARLVTVDSPLPIGAAVVIRAFGAEAEYAVGAVESGDAMGGARETPGARYLFAGPSAL